MVDRSWNTHRVEWREAEWREIRRVRHRVKIYDSFLKSWRIAGFLPGNTRVKRKRVGKRMVVSEDFLYCKATERHPRRRGVLRFSIRTGLSIFTPMPQTEVPNNMKRKDHLLICGARILIATCILQSDLGSLREIIIWELDGARLDPNGFIKIASFHTILSHLLVGFDMKSYPPLRSFHFEGVGDLVCMTHNNWELVVTYNLSDKSWGKFSRHDDMVDRIVLDLVASNDNNYVV
jgi:hypothetical protein